jgi:hypothetical protein
VGVGFGGAGGGPAAVMGRGVARAGRVVVRDLRKKAPDFGIRLCEAWETYILEDGFIQGIVIEIVGVLFLFFFEVASNHFWYRELFRVIDHAALILDQTLDAWHLVPVSGLKVNLVSIHSTYRTFGS